MAENSGGTGSEFIHVEMLREPDAGARGAGSGRERSVIPAGIFLMLFFIESLIAVGASAAYFIYTGTTGIRDIESDLHAYSRSVAGAFEAEAEASYKKKDYSGLHLVFREKMDERLMDEAFFVLRNGTRAAHLERKPGKKPGAGPAGEEWGHSPELILAPVRRATGETIIADYFIPSKPLPFRREVRHLLQRYFYTGIESNGWLVTRAVLQEKEPVGAVGFIIGKQKIYAFIEENLRTTLRLLLAGLAAAFLISLVISFVVYLRYRSIRRGAPRGVAAGGGSPARDEFYDMTPAPPGVRESRETPGRPAAGGSPFSQGVGIKDAIPVRGKE